MNILVVSAREELRRHFEILRTDEQAVLHFAAAVDEAVEILHNQPISLIFAELDSSEMLRHLQNTSAEVIAMAQHTDTDAIRQALAAGASDFLLLPAASDIIQLRYQLFCKRAGTPDSSLHDETTGLFRQDIFETMGNQQLKLARRNENDIVIIMVKLRDATEIKDKLGRETEKTAIAQAAFVINETFRDSDIIGRVGHDEFAIIALGAEPENIEKIKSKLRTEVNRYNSMSMHPFKLELETGSATLGSDSRKDMSQMLIQARANLNV